MLTAWYILRVTGSKFSFSVFLSKTEMNKFYWWCFQIKKLKGQLEGRPKNSKDLLRSEDGILENGTDVHVLDLQSKCWPLCGNACFRVCWSYTLVAKMPGIPSWPLVAPEFHSTQTLFMMGKAKRAGGGMSLWDGASVPECTGGDGCFAS